MSFAVDTNPGKDAPTDDSCIGVHCTCGSTIWLTWPTPQAPVRAVASPWQPVLVVLCGFACGALAACLVVYFTLRG